MSYSEHSVSFECAGQTLLGIVSIPAEAKVQEHTGVVIIVGGPQYRVGSHRQFVLLSRRLATSGFPVLRFDYRGMGDSTGAFHTFENVNDDVAAAINALQAATGVKNIVLWGLCDGASAALLYLHSRQDARVRGLCLLNPWVRSDASLAKTRVKHYYGRRLRQREFWLKLLSGKVAAKAVITLIENLKKFASSSRQRHDEGHDRQSFQSKMESALQQFTQPILLILSGNDYTAKEFLEYTSSSQTWATAMTRASLERHDLADVDHTFSGQKASSSVESITIEWLQKLSLAHKL